MTDKQVLEIIEIIFGALSAIAVISAFYLISTIFDQDDENNNKNKNES